MGLLVAPSSVRTFAGSEVAGLLWVLLLWHTLINGTTFAVLVAIGNDGLPPDVELIEPVTTTTVVNKTSNNNNNNDDNGTNFVGGFHKALRTVFHYPSYVKGEDPVEEYNRRRLHVSTASFEKGSSNNERDVPPEESKKLLEQSLIDFRRKFAKRSDQQELKNSDEKSKSDKLKMRERHSRRSSGRRYRKERHPIKRIWMDNTDSETQASMVQPRRYEESDPDVFPYERSEDNQEQRDLPEDTKYFQDTYREQKSPLELEFGHLYETLDRWEERYERQDHKNHRHQGKVKWADKNGGFGEHYWDLNHVAT